MGPIGSKKARLYAMRVYKNRLIHRQQAIQDRATGTVPPAAWPPPTRAPAMLEYNGEELQGSSTAIVAWPARLPTGGPPARVAPYGGGRR